MAITAEGRPKFTVNVVVLVVCVVQGIMLLATAQYTWENFIGFFRTGMPRPLFCGPLLLAWAILCALYIKGALKSPKILTLFAAICVYFGTMTLLSFRPGDVDGNLFVFAWATSVHALEAYIGYGYFIESVIRKWPVI
jgi:hypothetical protein